MDCIYQYLSFEVDKVRYAVAMDYVAYIVSASDPFPACTLPGQNSYIDRIVSIQEELIAVVELTGFEKRESLDKTVVSRPLILILRHQKGLVGILADFIASPMKVSEPRLEKDFMNRHEFLICGTERFVLFDVSRLCAEMNSV